MGIGDVRYTVLEITNQVQRKLGLDATSSLSVNKIARQILDFINDTCNELSDLGNWQETVVSSNVTAVSGQSDYSVSTSANIKNIGDIFFTQRTGPLSYITTQDMRLLTRVTAVGTPSQFTIFGTDSNGNPNIRVRPIPDGNSAGYLFSIVYYIRAPLYSTSDSASVVPFPGSIVVEGVLAKYLLNESGGAPTDRYTRTYQAYLEMRKEALNRFNGDTGWDVSFVSPNWRRR